jgi:DNA-binding NtrC family response regulator
MPLSGLKVLLVEDEFIIAHDLKDRLTDLNCLCVGPAFDVESALILVLREPIDAAILDVRLRHDQRIDTVADLLGQCGIPFAFATGDSSGVPEKWRDRPTLIKPFSNAALVDLIRHLTREHEASTQKSRSAEADRGRLTT